MKTKLQLCLCENYTNKWTN